MAEQDPQPLWARRIVPQPQARAARTVATRGAAGGQDGEGGGEGLNGKSGLGEKGGGGGGGRGKWYPSLECVRSTSASSVGGARELIPRVEGDATQRAASIQRWNTSKCVICVKM